MSTRHKKVPSLCRDGNTRLQVFLFLTRFLDANPCPLRSKTLCERYAYQNCLVLAVVLGVMTARLGVMLFGVAGMAVGAVGVMRGLFMVAGLVVLGGFAVMLGGVLVVFGGLVVMVDGVLAHICAPGLAVKVRQT